MYNISNIGIYLSFFEPLAWSHPCPLISIDSLIFNPRPTDIPPVDVLRPPSAWKFCRLRHKRCMALWPSVAQLFESSRWYHWKTCPRKAVLCHNKSESTSAYSCSNSNHSKYHVYLLYIVYHITTDLFGTSVTSVLNIWRHWMWAYGSVPSLRPRGSQTINGGCGNLMTSHELIKRRAWNQLEPLESTGIR